MQLSQCLFIWYTLGSLDWLIPIGNVLFCLIPNCFSLRPEENNRVSANTTYKKFISQIYGTGMQCTVYPALALTGLLMWGNLVLFMWYFDLGNKRELILISLDKIDSQVLVLEYQSVMTMISFYVLL